jgi:hypothetical protein
MCSRVWKGRMAVQTSRDLPVPDEFDFAFICEEEETVFLRERLALLDQLDEVALFGVGEAVSFAVVWSCHNGVPYFMP